ncbi:MAG: CAT RNA binding domain-containing protein [Pseudolactococcus laudensis]
MQISKILNNNVVITEKDQAEVVAMGRGLAFGKKIGDKIAVEKIEKCYTLQGDESSRIDELLAEIPDEIFVITDKVITLAKDKIPGKINDSLFLSLADHINATQLRAKEGFVVKNFLLWDIKRFFPTEFTIGKKAVADIAKKFGLSDLLDTDDEAGFIAMHIVNSELGRGDSSASELTKLMEEMLTIVKYAKRCHGDFEFFYGAKLCSRLDLCDF